MNVVVLNIEKINYDHKLDISILPGDVTFYKSSSEVEILDRVQHAEVIVTKELPLTREVIEQFPSTVKLICEAGTGFNNIDLAACKKKHILVCNTPEYATKRVAHTTIMMILNLSSSIVKQQRMLLEGNHDNFTNCMQVEHVEVNEKILGIIGAGNIGREVMKVAQALGMNILVYSRSKHRDEEGIHYVSFETLLQQSDYISLHCPLNEQTRGMINAEALRLMKPSAFLINTSRGGLIDEEALIKALQDHRIAGAGLDVQEKEPPVENNPLYHMDQVVLTPHMGWRGLETRQRLLKLVADNIDAYRRGLPIHIVD